jgi:hypothetical protein
MKQQVDTTTGLKMKGMLRLIDHHVKKIAMKKSCSNKNCPSKGKPLPLSKFYKKAASRDGYETRCIECRLEYDSKRFADKRGLGWLKVIIGNYLL